MSLQSQLLDSLLNNFSTEPAFKDEAVEILRNYSTEWIQHHRVLEKVHGIIEKFEIQSQANKHKALKSCVEHYLSSHDPEDENYSHILHLLMALSQNALQSNTGRRFRDLQTIMNQIKSSQMDNDNSGMADAFMSRIASSQQLSEWTREWEECDEDLSDWTEDDPLPDHKDSNHCDDDDGDEEIMDNHHCISDDANIQSRGFESVPNGTQCVDEIVGENVNAPSMYNVEVTAFESLVSALMGVDTIYFKWRKDHFVCLGSGPQITEYCSLLEYANYYRDCKNILDDISKRSSQTPLCIKALCHVIAECLQIYRETLHWFISSTFYATESVLELSHFMTESFCILECIYKDIILCFDDEWREKTLSTHSVLSHLYKLVQDTVCEEYSVRSSTIMSLFLGTVRPYLDMMDEWMLNGRLIDPFNEFFVTQTRQSINQDTMQNHHHHHHHRHHQSDNDNERKKLPRNIWRDFVLCPEKIPCFLSRLEISESILVCGKSWRILSHLQRTTNKEFKRRVKPYASSYQFMYKLLARYYPIECCIAAMNPDPNAVPNKANQSDSASSTSSSPIKSKSDSIDISSKTRKSPSSCAPKMGKLNAVQMMTWITTTERVFADTPHPSSSLKSPLQVKEENLSSLHLVQHKRAHVLQPRDYHTRDDEELKSSDGRGVVHVPFEHIIHDQWLSRIDTYCHRMNRILSESIDLLPHLLELRLFYFLGASDVVNPLLESLIDILSSPGWSKQLRIADALHTAIQDSVYRDSLPEGINVEWTVGPQSADPQSQHQHQDQDEREEVHLSSVIHQISRLNFKVSIEWPLNIVLNRPVLHCYNRIFKFLLQLKASKLLVERIDMKLREWRKTRKGNDDNVVHRFLMLRHKIYLFINTFNNYCSLQMDTTKWHEVLTDIMENGIGLDQICKKHDHFMKQMLQSLFLPQTEREQNMITSHIGHLLLCSDDLLRCWEEEVTEYLQFGEEIKNVKATSLFQHEKNKNFRLEDSAMKRISIIEVKFERLYKFCLLTIQKIKRKSLSHDAINVVSHLDFSRYYAHIFQLHTV